MSFDFQGRIWDLIVSVPDPYLFTSLKTGSWLTLTKMPRDLNILSYGADFCETPRRLPDPPDMRNSRPFSL